MKHLLDSAAVSTATEVMKHIWFFYSACKLALSLARALDNHDIYVLE
jgi:hypothetical protein